MYNKILLVIIILSLSIVVLLYSIKPSCREDYNPSAGYTLKYGKYENQGVDIPQDNEQPPFPKGSFENVRTECMNGTCTHINDDGSKSKVRIIPENPFLI